MHCLLEALERSVKKNILWKAVPMTGKARKKRVEMFSQPVFCKFNQEVVTGRMGASYSCCGGSED